MHERPRRQHRRQARVRLDEPSLQLGGAERSQFVYSRAGHLGEERTYLADAAAGRVARWVVGLGWKGGDAPAREVRAVRAGLQPRSAQAAKRGELGDEHGTSRGALHQPADRGMPRGDGLPAFIGAADRWEGESPCHEIVVLGHVQLGVDGCRGRDGRVNELRVLQPSPRGQHTGIGSTECDPPRRGR
eukprot:scaffold3164_cov112-Isochrysis_galbana.AAC.2